ncbi:MAG: hypothetical protein IJ571_06095 [Ruminococcus sp.]|nr:hypothetical protein [Ruminococcus sp.]
MTVEEKINEKFKVYEANSKWCDMLTDELDDLFEKYDHTDTALRDSNTYAAVKNTIDTIMQESGVSEYQLNSSLSEECEGDMFVADFVVSYIQDGMKTISFTIETDY